jgi:peptide/nickel transport system permease protein
MFRYIVRRLLWACVLFIAVTMVTYVIFFIIPNDPAVLAAGKSATPADIARARHFLGLDHSVPVQYLLFLKRLVVEQSLGTSFVNRRSVNTMVGEAAPVTASLVIGGAILWMALAIPIGILSALRPRSFMDRAAMIFVLVGISMPVVFIGLVLQ